MSAVMGRADELLEQAFNACVGLAWIKPSQQMPADDQLVVALHTSWGEPRPALATYMAHGEWYSGGMSLQCVVGWYAIPQLEVPL